MADIDKKNAEGLGVRIAGICKLCRLHDSELQDSHLMPKMAYKKLRGSKNESPTMIDPNRGVAVATNEQITKHLLCKCCEELFNKNGEAYVARFALQSDGSFPLINALNCSKPAQVAAGARVWLGSDIKGVTPNIPMPLAPA